MTHLRQLNHGSGGGKGRHRVNLLEIMRALHEAAPALLEVLVDACYVNGPIDLDSIISFSVEHLQAEGCGLRDRGNLVESRERNRVERLENCFHVEHGLVLRIHVDSVPDL